MALELRSHPPQKNQQKITPNISFGSVAVCLNYRRMSHETQHGILDLNHSAIAVVVDGSIIDSVADTMH